MNLQKNFPNPSNNHFRFLIYFNIFFFSQINKSASIKQLQNKIQQVVNEQQEDYRTEGTPSGRRQRINWRSVWRSTDLDYEGTRLTAEPRARTRRSDNSDTLKLLTDFGITEDGARIRFVRRRFQKATPTARKWMVS